jgi:hypothetical protein
MTILPLVRHVFQCLKDAVGAGIDGNWRAIAPENLTPVVNNEQRTFADAVNEPAGGGGRRRRGLGYGICLTPKVAPLGLTVPSALLVAERG